MSNYTIIKYKDYNKSDWDISVAIHSEATYHHTWSWIRYISNFENVVENLSFIVLNETKEPVAICPLCISNNEILGLEFSFGGNPCAIPAIKEESPSKRRKLLDFILSLILDYGSVFKVEKIKMIWDPLAIKYINTGLAQTNQFEFIKYNFYYSVENIVLIDLTESEDLLMNKVSKYQRRHIRQAGKKGLTIKNINSNSSLIDVDKYFTNFREAHFLSAGKATRPISTWEIMKDMLLQNEAILFVGIYNNEPVSFLFCGLFDNSAFGWSQVNIEEYEKELSPRQFIEWSAILYFKENGLKYYEVGERFYPINYFKKSSNKEVSISILKERFGGFFSHKITWNAYFYHKSFILDFENNYKKTDLSSLLININVIEND